MFGDEPVENRKWKVEKLGTLCSKITDGTHKTPSYQHQGITFISAKNIIDEINNKLISEIEDYDNEKQDNCINNYIREKR